MFRPTIIVAVAVVAVALTFTITAPAAGVRPPHYSQWLCIHAGEGAWNANTGNGYYGGLQMDYGFMRAYGPTLLARRRDSRGNPNWTADHWTPLEQMWVAERAWKTRSFYPWPTTARRCGLI